MKKKKQKPTPAAAAVTADCDLKSIIHSHSEFFDRLIELIPARFYLPNDGPDSKSWYQGLSKTAKASLKQQSIQNLKSARRHRFDPDGEPSSTLHLLQQQLTSKAPLPHGEHPSNLEDDESPPNPVDTAEDKDKSVTYEELRQKLRRKIELLRGNRGEKKIYEKRVKNDDNNRKRSEEKDGGDSEKGGNMDEDEDCEEIIEYGKVILGDEDEGKHVKKKKKKLPKVKELEIAKKKEEEKKENPSVAERKSWKAATSRALGMKVHDDARLMKEKTAEKWKERVETQDKMKVERQRKKKIYEKRVKNDDNKRKRSEEKDGGDSEKGGNMDEDEDCEEIIEYGKVILGDEDEGKHVKKKKKKLPKVKELEIAKKKEEEKKENPSVAERESWKAATSRALGMKVHDDARLIKESMRKERRKKEKTAEKWKERVETQDKMKGERQRKRKENIAGRINEKKMRKIAKREKKLMRPGFEGRKEGYITKE
ncbi:hypothetical protein OROMI_002243 [Orobanche minor]